MLGRRGRRRDEAASRPKNEFVPKTLAELNIEGLGSHSDGLSNGGRFITSNTHKTKTHPNSNSKFNNNNDNNYDRTNRRHPDNLFTNITNFDISSSNNNNYNSIFSSQQNLAKTNIIHSNSNMTRNRNFGSQQSLSTASNHSTSTTSSHRTNQNNNYNSNMANGNSTQRSAVQTTDLLLNLNSASSATANHYATNHTTNFISSLNDINSISTDAWLNAWNSPPVVQRAASVVPAASSDFTLQSYHTHTTTTTNRNLLSNFNSQNGHNCDPWKGDFKFIFLFFCWC